MNSSFFNLIVDYIRNARQIKIPTTGEEICCILQEKKLMTLNLILSKKKEKTIEHNKSKTGPEYSYFHKISVL